MLHDQHKDQSHLHGALHLLQVSLLSVQLGLPVSKALLPLPNLAKGFCLELLLPGLQLLLMLRQLFSPCLYMSQSLASESIQTADSIAGCEAVLGCHIHAKTSGSPGDCRAMLSLAVCNWSGPWRPELELHALASRSAKPGCMQL